MKVPNPLPIPHVILNWKAKENKVRSITFRVDFSDVRHS